MIEAVLFDYDGVLTRDKTGSLTTCRYLSTRTGIPELTIREAFRQFNTDLNLGRTTHEQIWSSFCTELGLPVDIGLLAGAFKSTPINKEMMALAVKLSQAYVLGIVTDNKRDRAGTGKSTASCNCPM